MYQHVIRWLFVILIISTGTGICADIPYVFGEEGGVPLDDSSFYVEDDTFEQGEEADASPLEPTDIPLSYDGSDTEIPLLADYDDSDAIVFSTASGSSSSKTVSKSRTVGAIKNEINGKVDVDNEITRNAAVVIAAKYPGEYNIDQIISVHNYLKNGWTYVEDPRGIDYYSSASNTLQLGKELGCVGIGDCDDFAILMSALIESIGGTTRIILAYDNSSGHAYAEVYLGQKGNRNHHVQDIINWLRSECNTDKIYTHLDPAANDIWLNLDWSADHPGGPFWHAKKHKPLLIREQYGKVPPKLPEGYVFEEEVQPTEHEGLLRCQVTDGHGSPLITTIVLTDEDGKTRLGVTDRYGTYKLSLAPGRYELTADKTGYYFEKITVNIRSGRETPVPIHGEEEYIVDTGVTLGEPYVWSDDELVNYYK